MRIARRRPRRVGRIPARRACACAGGDRPGIERLGGTGGRRRGCGRRNRPTHRRAPPSSAALGDDELGSSRQGGARASRRARGSGVSPRAAAPRVHVHRRRGRADDHPDRRAAPAAVGEPLPWDELAAFDGIYFAAATRTSSVQLGELASSWPPHASCRRCWPPRSVELDAVVSSANDARSGTAGEPHPVTAVGARDRRCGRRQLRARERPVDGGTSARGARRLLRCGRQLRCRGHRRAGRRATGSRRSRARGRVSGPSADATGCTRHSERSLSQGSHPVGSKVEACGLPGLRSGVLWFRVGQSGE